jgi:hypothetical protein
LAEVETYGKKIIKMADRNACTIIIDTNQFFPDWLLSSARWSNLIEYLNRTDATLIFPEIIWREIGENYVCEGQKKQRAACQNLQAYLDHRHFYYSNGNAAVKHSPVSIDRDQLLQNEDWNSIQKAYLACLKEKLKIDPRHIITFNHQWLEKITDRAIKHTKPFAQESDKGFKDSILWLTLLDLKNRAGFSDNPIVLISSNTKDFSDGNNPPKLHADLIAEASRERLQIEYYKSLDAFLDDWPREVLLSHKEIVRAVTPKFIKDNIFDKAKAETIKKHGFNIESKQLEVTNVNYVVTHDNGTNIAEVSCSGFIDLGKEFMRLAEFTANLKIALDKHSNPNELLNQTFLFTNAIERY